MKAVPAAQVFRRDALPLYLPALDQHLADPELFPKPVFSDPKVLATDIERALYDYDEEASTRVGGSAGAGSRKRSQSKTMEAAGGQFRIPAAAVRQRRKGAGSEKQSLEGKDEEERLAATDDEDEDKQQKAALLNGAKPVRPRAISRATTAPTMSAGVPSRLSTAASPVTRLEMFPPLMLLRDTHLSELKSNAVGPRAPPGGLLGVLPALGSFLGTIIDFIIGMEGSSFAAGLMNLELFRDFAQIWSNMINSRAASIAPASSSQVTRILFFTIPNLLALDFASVFGRAIIFFLVWLGVTAFALVAFYRMTSSYDPNREVEGYEFQPYIFTTPARGTKVTNILVVFTLTALYIPLTKFSIDILAWQASWWPVPNPYSYDSDTIPDLPPLGPSTIYRDPLDFCWTTTMRKDEFNYAYLLIPSAALSIIFYTLWFPYRMVMVIRQMLPRVPKYNELGHKRSAAEMEKEYYRLVGNDKSPLNFMYNAYRRRLGFCEWTACLALIFTAFD